MVRPAQPGLTENELEIMKLLWNDSPLKVSDLLALLNRVPKPAYTSLLTLVQTMEKKGYIKHQKEGKAFSYRPVLQKKKYFALEVKQLIKRLFAGDASQLVVNLVENEQLSKHDIRDLKKLLEDAE